MKLNQIQLLARQGESSILEFKATTAKLKSAFETTCAFLNGNGGTVLIGVKDDGQIVGQTVTDNTRLEIANEIKKIEPTADINVHYTKVNENCYAIAIEVKSGKHIPYIYDGRAFQRNESQTDRMSQHRYEQLLVKRKQLNYAWESFPADDYDINMLDEEEIHQTVLDGIAEKRIPATTAKENTEKILRQLGLLENGKLKRAAVALFGKEIKVDYWRCWLKMARFKGIDKSGEFIDNQQIHCNVFRMLREADNFFRKHLMVASYFKPDQFKRIDKLTLPAIAVREALVNAICHRDYSDRSGYISIAIFDDRVEIWNNGALPEKLKLQDLKHKHDSILRNELIAEVFYLRGYIETWGTGTLTMIDLCKAEGIPPPKFSERTGGIIVTFKFAEPIGASKQKNIGNDMLSIRQEEIIDILSKNKVKSANEIFHELTNPPSLRTVKADLSTLLKIGLVEQQGKGRSAMWRIKSQILLVDDDPKVLILLKDYLVQAGYMVTCMENASHVLDFLKSDPKRFSLVILDRMMPAMSGIDLLHKITFCAELQHIPIIMLTNHAEKEDITAAVRAGVYDFLFKPIEKSLLLMVVKRAIQKWRLLTEKS